MAWYAFRIYVVVCIGLSEVDMNNTLIQLLMQRINYFYHETNILFKLHIGCAHKILEFFLYKKHLINIEGVLAILLHYF